MGRCRFVQPDVVRLPLSEGEWIDVKRELNTGEYRRVFARQLKEMSYGDKAVVDPSQVGLSKVVEYIVAWSFKDLAGKSTQPCESTILALDSQTFGEIVSAVDSHEEAMDGLREKEKNVRDGANASKAISPSPSEPVGAMSGSTR